MDLNKLPITRKFIFFMILLFLIIATIGALSCRRVTPEKLPDPVDPTVKKSRLIGKL